MSGEARLPGRNEDGTALITSLVMVAIMSVAAMALLESVRFSTRVSVNVAARDQARLYAIGAEQLAAGTIRDLREKGGEDRFPALDIWTRTPVEYPIPEGSIAGRVSDGANCFNLNSLVVEAEGGYIADAKALTEFSRMLALADMPRNEAEQLGAVIADWIDSDSRPGFGGAEDPFYTSQRPGYRTPGQLMADISELKLMKDMDTQLYERVRPFLCVRPNVDPSVLNINTLQTWQAALLAVYLGEDIGVDVVERLLAERPEIGFASIEEVLAAPSLAGRVAKDSGLENRIALASSYYDMNVTVRYREAVIHLTATLQISASGNITTVSRHHGTLE